MTHGDRAGRDRVGAEVGADRALLQHLERRRQGAGAQQQRQVAGLLRGEAAGDAGREPPRIGSRMTGALITLSSSTMANGLPTFSRVTSPKRRAPTESNRKLTTGSPSLERAAARRSGSPPTMTRLRTSVSAAAGRRTASRLGRQQLEPAGSAAGRRPPPAARVDQTEGHLRGRGRAACLMRSGSSTPGSCTRMRSSPWRWIVGSRVPVSSMRRRTISIDCCNRGAPCRAAALRCSATVDLRALRRESRGRPPGRRTASRAFSRVLRPQDGERRPCLPRRRARCSRSARCAAPCAPKSTRAVEPLAHHRLDLDLEQEVRAALQVEPERKLVARHVGRDRCRPVARPSRLGAANATPSRTPPPGPR